MLESFRVGDMVVYPAHGIGKINSISEKSIGGIDCNVFDITIMESGVKVMVPVGKNGLRKIADKKTVEEIFDILRDRAAKVDTQTWNRRSRDYSLKLKTGSVIETARVLRDLYVLREVKELSYGEKDMLDKAKTMLVSELAIARGRSEEQVKIELDAIFHH